MPVIPVNLDDIKESNPVPAGRYNVVITSVEETLSRNEKPRYEVSIEIEGHEDAPTIMHYVSLPTEGDEPGTLRFKLLLLKRFCHLFGVNLTGNELDTEALAMKLVGRRASAELSLEKERDQDGKDKPGGRVFNRLVIPNLPQGEVSSVKPPKR
jgi:hypothetical protein